MPLQPAASRYLHFSMRTPLCQVSLRPLNSTSTSIVSSGPTSHAKTFFVILAFSSALHCSHPGRTSACFSAQCTGAGGAPPIPSSLAGARDVAMLLVSRAGAAVQGADLTEREQPAKDGGSPWWQQAFQDSQYSDCLFSGGPA